MKQLLTSFIFLFAFASFAQKPQLHLVRVASGFSSPVDIKSCGDDRIFVVQQRGLIRIMDKQGNINPTPFLDLSSRGLSSGNEQGLLSMAFSPNYSRDSSFYVNYNVGSGGGSTVISRFKVSANPNVADLNSEQILLSFPQPFTNHKGATLMFGKDGYLYDTQGDGGGSGDPQGNGQNQNTYLGKILRLDVSDTDTTYTIPATNPFVGQANKLPEIWAYGLRNPWRCAVDRLTGGIYIADVGQDTIEEVNFQPAASAGGENYGWKCYEGTLPYNATGCAATGFTWPVYQYEHTGPNGCSITGGYVYRGTQFQRMFGRYFFTDFCSGRFWSTQQIRAGGFTVDTFASFLTQQYGTFGEDNDGELYIAGQGNGIIYHITDTSYCAPVAYIISADSSIGCNRIRVSALAGDSLGYQWYGPAGAIAGAVSDTLIATQTGWYSVQVTNQRNGCFSSDSIYLDMASTLCTGIADLSDAFAFGISPNPNHGSFTLDLRGHDYKAPQLSVVDGVGRVCLQRDISSQKDNERIAIDLSFLSKGVYTVVVKDGGNSAVKRMIVD